MIRGFRLTTGVLLTPMLVAALWVGWPQTLGGRLAYVKVDGHSMDPTYHFGDLAIVRRQASYQLGDPVAYRIPRGEFGAGALVIHRLVGGDGVRGFTTRGDNRTIVDPWHPRTQDILGRVRYDVPGLGTRFAQAARPLYLGLLVGGLTALVLVLPSRSAAQRPRRRRRTTGRHAAVAR